MPACTRFKTLVKLNLLKCSGKRIFNHNNRNKSIKAITLRHKVQCSDAKLEGVVHEIYVKCKIHLTYNLKPNLDM